MSDSLESRLLIQVFVSRWRLVRGPSPELRNKAEGKGSGWLRACVAEGLCHEEGV